MKSARARMKLDRIKTAIVLAGGQGLRLRPLTTNCPKAMVKLLGKPLLQWIVEWLRDNGIQNIVVGVADQKERIMRYFGDGSDFGTKIEYSVHTVKGETGEGFRLAINRYIKDGETFIAMNGDEITNMDVHRLIEFHFQYNPLATMVLSPLPCPYGVVEIDTTDNNVVSFVEKPWITTILINTGIYVFNKQILRHLPMNGPIETTTFPTLAKLGLLKAYVVRGEWVTIDTIKDLNRAEKMLQRIMENGKWKK